ncbi:MAG: F0F1 ATP synthase subunit B family protein [Bryobacteraceae bacterium]
MIHPAVLLALAAVAALASPEAAEHGAAHNGDPYIAYKWFNFAILAAGLGYLFVRFAVPALRSQQASILKQLAEAQQRAAEAERRSREVEEKVAGLEREIEKMKKQAAEEMAIELRQMEDETRRLLEKVDQQAQLEIASAVEHARKELRALAVDLAIDMARQRLSGEVARGAQEPLVERFVRSLDSGPGGKN